MKKVLGVAFIIMLAVFSLAAQKGPIADKVQFGFKMQEEIGLKDAAEGITDVFLWGVTGPTFNGLDKATRDKIEAYSVPSGSWSLELNPYPNKAPYIVKNNEGQFFNPFAIQKVRYALNFLISRKYIVDEILAGTGSPMYNMATPGWPSSYKYELLSSKFGFTAEGNEKKALKDIEDAMKEASNLPELKGKLVRKSDFWYYNNQPVTLKFLIRVDDPNGRLRVGEYVSNQIEKAGIKVDRLKWERAKCINVTRGTNPSDYQWSMYTEGWGSGEFYSYWDQISCQMYAPWYGQMPGNQIEGYWQYENEHLDKISKAAYTGKYLTEEDYWKLALETVEIGMRESVRIYLVSQDQYYAANKDRFENRFLIDLGAGIKPWVFFSADTKDNVLKATHFASRGSLFASAWDPIGTEGFSDQFINDIAGNTWAQGRESNPSNGSDFPYMIRWKDVDTKVVIGKDGELEGQLVLPSNAVLYNPLKGKWENVPSGTKAYSKATYTIVPNKWHHGRETTWVDYFYADGFIREWITKNSDNDKKYEQGYASNISALVDPVKGWVINSDNTVTIYYDYNFPADKNRVAQFGIPALSVTASGHYVGTSWEIIEALDKIITESNKSGTKYSITREEAFTEVDVLMSKCVEDIRAKLVEMKNQKWVPVYIRNFMTADEAVKCYDLAIKFIDEHKHALIANGPFILNRYDAETDFVELIANRNFAYSAEEIIKAFSTNFARIDKIEIPEMSEKGKDITIKAKISSISYPANKVSMLEKGSAKAILITSDKEMTFEMKMNKAGNFEGTIPASATKNLAEGTYTVVVVAEVQNGSPAAGSQLVIIY